MTYINFNTLQNAIQRKFTNSRYSKHADAITITLPNINKNVNIERHKRRKKSIIILII